MVNDLWFKVNGSRFRVKVSSLSEHESHELNEYCLQND